jgi:hypothetical protein
MVALTALSLALACHEPPKCERASQLVISDQNPMAVVPGTTPADTERCTSSTWNRIGPTTCTAETTLRECEPGDQIISCEDDSACGERGRCLNADGCMCFELCETDEDCGAGMACVCSAGVLVDPDGGSQSLWGLPQCVPAECKSAADCSGSPCGIVIDSACREPVQLRCRSPLDQCSTDFNCLGTSYCGGNDTGGWSCLDDWGSCE